MQGELWNTRTNRLTSMVLTDMPWQERARLINSLKKRYVSTLRYTRGNKEKGNRLTSMVLEEISWQERGRLLNSSIQKPEIDIRRLFAMQGAIRSEGKD